MIETDFSPSMLAGADDPYALLAAERAKGPVLRSPGGCLVLGYAEANTLLRSGKTRSGFAADLYRSVLPEGAARDEMSHRINFLDPPDHPRVRSLVGKAFTPRRVSALAPRIVECCRALLEPLAGSAAVDLIPAFAHQVPSLVISELLGVPIEDRDRLTDWSDRVSRLLGAGAFDEEGRVDALEAAEQMHAYLRELAAERRARPRDDLLSALLAAEDDGARLSESELLSLAATLYSAGHRTTRDLFSNGLATLLSDASATADLRAGRVGVDAVVEEFLRFETPTHYVARMTTEPLELGGDVVPTDQPVVVVLASANRDERTYDRADRFEPRRWTDDPSPPAISFAFGAHFCIGASLARLEAATMLTAVFDVFPRVRLAGEPLRWRHTGLFRGLESLPLALD